MVNRKSNNKQFEIHGEYLHLYDTLTEIVNDEQTEYEGELYVVKTDLTEQVIENNYSVMLSFLKKIREQKRKCEHTKEIAQTYLDAIKNAEKNGAHWLDGIDGFQVGKTFVSTDDIKNKIGK